MKLRVLFVCATNGLHSTIAEALLTRIDARNFEARSAGMRCAELHPLTLEVMKEIGIDLSHGKPRPVEEIMDDSFDYVITVGDCDGFEQMQFPGAERLHWNFENPIAQSADPQKQLRAFRAVRDQIAQRLHLFVLVLARPHAVPSPDSMNHLTVGA